MTQTQPGWQAESPDGWLLVTVDRLPAWMLSAWGATWVATPAVTRIATAGLACDRVLVRSTEPADSLRELLTARLPVAAAAGSPAAGPLAAAAARGWKVTVVTDVPDQFAGLGVEQENLTLVAVPPQPGETTSATDEASVCGRVYAAAEAELAGADLLWCHLGSLGLTWDAPQACREAFFDPEDPPPGESATIPDFTVTAATDPDQVAAVRQLFAGELAHWDDWLGRLLAAAGSRWHRFGMLLLGLRGLPLGLHGRVGVGQPEPAPYAELTHVPALLIDPAGRQTAQRFGGLLLPADLGATVGDLIACSQPAGGVPPSPVTLGQSLERVLAGDADAWRRGGRDRIFSTSAGGQAVTVAEWACIREHGGGERLFVKPDDFFELSDVADRSHEVAAALADCLDSAVPQAAAAWEKPLPEVLVPQASADR